MVNTDPPDILKEIIAAKQNRVAKQQKKMPLPELKEMIKTSDYPLNFAGSLMGDSIRIIAEIKNASPSKGDFKLTYKPNELADIYAMNGAAAVSVLTNEDHFHGSIQDLAEVHSVLKHHKIPILRKEFIFNAYQIYAARAYGADAVLLITAMLSADLLKEFVKLSNSLWLQPLVEVHDELELDIALDSGAEMIGINNRNLHTFNTTLETTKRIATLVPDDKILISESGIKSRSDVLELKDIGVNAVLIGESLVISDDPGKKLRELI